MGLPRNSCITGCLLAVLSLPLLAAAQGVGPEQLVTEAIDDGHRAVLGGNTHPWAQAKFERGVAPDELPMERLLLVLKRSEAQDAALRRLLEGQQDARSAEYHRWLTPDQFGLQFGAAPEDLRTLTGWLTGAGFNNIRVTRGRGTIEFSGTAAQVRQTFHTEVRRYVVRGEEHWGNASDPEIPAALSRVVAGVASLNNFEPEPAIVGQPRQVTLPAGSVPEPAITSSTGLHALAPGDFDSIYSVPRYLDGTGVTIGIVANANFDVTAVANFRALFGLSVKSPQIVVNGVDPGIGAGTTEAILDSSWAGGIASNANIQVVVSKATNGTSGVDLSELYLVDNNQVDVISESFSVCEQNTGSALVAQLNAIREQAAAQGITFIVSSGDDGSAGCDPNSAAMATGPVAVSARASSPWDTAVGGTEFRDTQSDWTGPNGFQTSAYGYIPEAVWNDSCVAGECAKPNILSGSGGASLSFPKPSWQAAVPGIPNDGARDLPDVSFSASPYRDPYVLCTVSTDCVTNAQGTALHLVGGTSASAPAFAGIVALIVQSRGSRQGAINQTLYSLASQQDWFNCNATATCLFHDVLNGNNAVPGQAAYGLPGAPYQAGLGYDLASGLGSTSTSRLISSWTLGALEPVVVSLSVNPAQAEDGLYSDVVITALKTDGSPAPDGPIALQTANGAAIASLNLVHGSASTVMPLPLFNSSVEAHYPGTSQTGQAWSAPVAITFGANVNGCVPTTFAASPNPIVSNNGYGSSFIAANATCAYDVRVGSADGPLFVTGAGYSSTPTGNWLVDGMKLYLQVQGQNWSGGTLATLTINLRPNYSACVVGSFTATPNPALGVLTGSTTINADATCAYDIRVGAADGGLFVTGSGRTSTATGNWVTEGMVFYLQQQGSTASTATLETVTVHLQRPSCAVSSFYADPSIFVSQYLYVTTTIRANAACAYDIRIGAPDGALFASGSGETAGDTGDWVTDSMTFYLQLQGDTSSLGTLSTATVIVGL